MSKVTLEYDQDAENPMDNDYQWKLYSFGRSHSNFKQPTELGLSLQQDKQGNPLIFSLGLRKKLSVGLAFMCSYFEHGNCWWGLRDGVIPAGVEFRWDGNRNAGLLIWEHKAKELGPKTFEDRAKDAAGFLETYTAWCNGEVYWYSVEDGKDNVLDSCSGFYAGSYLIDEIRLAVCGRAYEVVGDAAFLLDGVNLCEEVALAYEKE